MNIIKNIKKETGFTLIELLVVIAIIGILATTVMTSLNMARFKARDVRRLSDIRQLQLALQMYYDSFGHYPTNPDDLVPTYIAAKPIDPDGINEYQYCITLSSLNYHLGTSEIGLEMEDSSALIGDADIENDGCMGGTSFSGEDPVYDVTP